MSSSIRDKRAGVLLELPKISGDLANPGPPAPLLEAQAFVPSQAASFGPAHPTSYQGSARVEHVVSALVADHQALAAERPVDVADKLSKMSESAYVFFRGTAGLFYRDLAGRDQELPVVLCNGDVHPENFGVMPGRGGDLVFGLDDFDEAYPAPFTWDLRRGATGFVLAAKELGYSESKSTKLGEDFCEAYVSALQTFSRSDLENEKRFSVGKGPKVIRRLLEAAGKEKRTAFLDKRLVDSHDAFKASDEIIPSSQQELPKFQAAIDRYRKTLGKDAPKNDDYFKVRAAARKLASGTGAMGRDRFYVLIEGKSDKKKNDRILEVKEQAASVMKPYVSLSGLGVQIGLGGASAAHEVQVVDGDPLLGHTKIDGQKFLVRERSPHKMRIDMSELESESLKEYAQACGVALAQAHARADSDTGLGKGSMEKRILASLDTKALPKQVAQWAQGMAQRVQSDYASFVKHRDALEGKLGLS